MGVRVALLSALVLIIHACGGEEFSDDPSGSGGTGATSSGGGGSSGAGGGGSGGASGNGGVSGGGSSGASGSGGASGSAGDASSDGTAGDSGGGDADAGPQAIAVIQSTPVKLSMAPAEQFSTISLAAAPTAGNSIIVGVSCISDYGVVLGDGGGALVNGDCLMPAGSVTDNQGNTYTQVVQGSPIKSSHQAARGYIFIAQAIGAPTGSFTIKVDPEGTSTVQAIAWGAIEVAGLSAPPSLDATGYTPSGGTAATTATTFQTTTQANELAVAVLSIRHNDVYAGIVHDSTWVSHQTHQDSVNGPPAHSMVSKILSSTGKPSHTWAHAVPSRGAAGVIATFKGALTN